MNKYFEELVDLIEINDKYFANKNAEDVASSFIEAYANGDKLPYAKTPSAFIASEVDTLLDYHGRIKWTLKITSTGGKWEDEFDSYDDAAAEAKRCFEKSQINTFGKVVQEYDDGRDRNVWENVSGSQYITDIKEVSDDE